MYICTYHDESCDLVQVHTSSVVVSILNMLQLVCQFPISENYECNYILLRENKKGAIIYDFFCVKGECNYI